MNQSNLVKIARTFNQVGLGWCVGGSIMLQCAGIDLQPRDIDLFVVPRDFDLALNLLNQVGKMIEFGPTSVFGSERFARGVVFDEEVDLIAGMRILGEDGWVEYDMDPTTTSNVLIEGEKIPYGNLEEWIGLYAAMNRLDKVRLIQSHLKNKGESQ
ncbi:MAG: hypothetical protein AB9921_10295 [Erysipelotrichaceae bacterium]